MCPAGPIICALPADYPEGGQVDFQVEAIAGYYKYWADERVLFVFAYLIETVETSGWSNTQTLIIENPEIIPEFPSWIILPLFLIATLMVIVYRRKMKVG